MVGTPGMVEHERSVPGAGSGDEDGFRLRYTIWSTALVILILSSQDLDRIFRFYVLLVPVLLVPTLVYLVAMLWALAASVAGLRWRRALSVLLAPVLAVSSATMLVRSGITPGYVRFEIGRSAYRAQVAALSPGNGSPVIRVWDWGDVGGVAVVNTLFLLVYDDSDQIALPADRRSPARHRSAERAARGNAFSSVLHPEASTADAAGDRSHASVSHLSGHFYEVALTL